MLGFNLYNTSYLFGTLTIESKDVQVCNNCLFYTLPYVKLRHNFS